ncbi:hypothetical protein H6F51_03835 [Cyanobacteria bacterium FACHB-DQ100]|uniref:hypothetical protein n=1 Tax=Leptolyngbya sp. FACHB-17 TaxID=2692803 RepID=UPI0016800C03|nr:hypothetical protein [Leptolyngbya sp. FACHB-17]MBD1821630.1 hypothetical protein [Cyanobacteria bacterium FACHB-DQ100]MBD2080473.1 hypothetical protein [Leptolyngbya sp. FACHB-17]
MLALLLLQKGLKQKQCNGDISDFIEFYDLSPVSLQSASRLPGHFKIPLLLAPQLPLQYKPHRSFIYAFFTGLDDGDRVGRNGR